ncbi:Bifunctional dethiobiotin synthetase/7,8-diamino-pelargonic acid aminotransferase [Lasiodiplodia theobromae]|uniref:Bifunctional dethiobiotin synthetase/7,8-diamino-pelargonic acid aminotransferase n=1 Tax=Lasiodiplodia theobromae TaxID=45133 RepID=A0A5N5CYH6_9PEZI|nr:Bifunctional dethiobiotin synthetase/7,8-diamino-pelargonic acid aminotransferase [Lasiodiplodia theobromae]
MNSTCLYQYEQPVSPNIAAANSTQDVVSDPELLSKVHKYVSVASKQSGWLFCETAGGVHSPGPSGTSQADLYRPLRLPAILIGDSKLGGISATISAFESLRIRGYDVESVFLFKDETYQNHEYLTTYFQKFDIPCAAIPPPPERDPDPKKDKRMLMHYYSAMARSNLIQDVLKLLSRRHEERFKSLETMSTEAHKTIWYPFTQQKLLSSDKITAIDSAYGDYFQTFSANPPNKPLADAQANEPPANEEDLEIMTKSMGELGKFERRRKYSLVREEKRKAAWPFPQPSNLRPSFDGSASWWTQGLGHANPQLTLAAAYAAGRYGHVMFAEAVHKPALQLAQMLLKGSNNPRLSRVFYSDNGSTGTEVSVKMALRAARLRYGWSANDDLNILGLRGSYHGDTMGAMDCSEPGTYNEKIEWYRGKGYWFDFPTVKMTNGKWTVQVPEEIGAKPATFENLEEIFDFKNRDNSTLSKKYQEFISRTLTDLQKQGRKFGALMLEPMVLGAGGMQLADPLFQRTLIEVVRRSPHLFATDSTKPENTEIPKDENNWSGLPVVFDEVFTGLYRLGHFTAASLLGVHPDISVNAKLLTGGLVPLATTMASEHIFKSFESDDKSEALLHGHSYTAHAVGCQVGVASVSEMQKMEKEGAWDTFKESWEMAVAKEDYKVEVTAWSVWHQQFVEELSRRVNRIEGIWALGSVLAIHFKDDSGSGYKSNASRALQAELLEGAGLRSFGPEIRGQRAHEAVDVSNVHSRVLGNVLYLMASQTSTPQTIRGIESWLLEADALR